MAPGDHHGDDSEGGMDPDMLIKMLEQRRSAGRSGNATTTTTNASANVNATGGNRRASTGTMRGGNANRRGSTGTNRRGSGAGNRRGSGAGRGRTPTTRASTSNIPTIGAVPSSFTGNEVAEDEDKFMRKVLEFRSNQAKSTGAAATRGGSGQQQQGGGIRRSGSAVSGGNQSEDEDDDEEEEDEDKFMRKVLQFRAGSGATSRGSSTSRSRGGTIIRREETAATNPSFGGVDSLPTFERTRSGTTNGPGISFQNNMWTIQGEDDDDDDEEDLERGQQHVVQQQQLWRQLEEEDDDDDEAAEPEAYDQVGAFSVSVPVSTGQQRPSTTIGTTTTGSTTNNDSITAAAAATGGGGGEDHQYYFGNHHQAAAVVAATTTTTNNNHSTEMPQYYNSNKSNSTNGKKKLLVWGGVCIAIIVAIIVVVLVVLDNGGSNNKDGENNNDLSSTLQGDGGEAEEEKYDDLLPEHLIMSDLPESTLKAISEFRTPQAIAYDWLANDPYLSNYTDWRRKQRFALATFAFTSQFSSRNYFSVADAMDWYPLHECQWFSTFEDSCPVTEGLGHFTKLKLRVGGSYPMSDLHLSLELLTPEMSSLVNLQTVDSKDRSFVTTSSRNPDDLGFPTSLLQMTNLRYLKINNPGSNKGMVGTLPAQLGTKLSLLEHLDLSFNSFSGPIPSQYGLLEKLQVLRLGHNQLNGTIPMNWWGQNNNLAMNLTTLDVSANPDLVAEVPSGFCSSADDGPGSDIYFETDWCNGKLECCRGEV